MLRFFIAPIVQFLATAAYALTLTFVLLIVGFTGGEVLDLGVAVAGPHALTGAIISLGCWAVLLALPAWAAVTLMIKFRMREGDQRRKN